MNNRYILDLEAWQKFHADCPRYIKTAFMCECSDEDVCQVAFAAGALAERELWHSTLSEECDLGGDLGIAIEHILAQAKADK